MNTLLITILCNLFQILVYSYTKFNGDSVIIILFWVDDILIASSNNQMLVDMKNNLGNRFKMKDMGILSWFLGMEFIFHDNYVMINHKKYCEKILERFDMMNCKSKSIPCDMSINSM